MLAKYQKWTSEIHFYAASKEEYYDYDVYDILGDV